LLAAKNTAGYECVTQPAIINLLPLSGEEKSQMKKIEVYSVIYEGKDTFDFTKENYLKFCQDTKTKPDDSLWKQEADGSRTLKAISTAGENITIVCRSYARSFIKRELPWVFEQIKN
jgi:hypothetical protein